MGVGPVVTFKSLNKCLAYSFRTFLNAFEVDWATLMLQRKSVLHLVYPQRTADIRCTVVNYLKFYLFHCRSSFET